jgi:hypothetical protein
MPPLLDICLSGIRARAKTVRMPGGNDVDHIDGISMSALLGYPKGAVTNGQKRASAPLIFAGLAFGPGRKTLTAEGRRVVLRG